MMNFLKKIGVVTLATLLIVVPSVVFAQSGGTSGGSSGGSNNSSFPTLENPLGGINSITKLVNALVDIAFQIGSVVAVLAVIYVGFKFVLARGNESEVEEAKKMFFWVVVGIAVLFGARVLSEIIQATVNNLKNY